MKNVAILINQDSGNCDYYTPQRILNAARSFMGGIDLDPASSLIANDYVLAARYFDIEQDGLNRPWFGRVWLNHPFGRHANKLWIDKLLREHEIGNIQQACCITFASTSESWFQPLLQYPQCFLSPRTNYYAPDGSRRKGVTKGSVVTCVGGDVERFKYHFQYNFKLGRVK